MKKLIKVTSLLSAVVLGAVSTGVGVANAADITADNNTTTATVGLEDDADAKIQLTKAPSFDFGSEKIGGDPMDLKINSVDDPITVVNPGKNSGWNVTVKGSNFVGSDGTTELKGALLTLNGVVSPADTGNQSVAPTTGSVVVSDQDAPIFTAAANAGLGTWLNTYTAGDNSANLHIPAGNTAGSYTSTLTWTLADAPQ